MGKRPGRMAALALFTLTAFPSWVASTDSRRSFFHDPYNFSPDSTMEFEPLPERVKRETAEDDNDDTVDNLWKRPSDASYDIQNDTTDHIYYTMQNFTNNVEQLKKYFVNVEEMLSKPGVVGNKSHPLLSNSYRRAVGAKLTFQFPFYGHHMQNITIATGGFCYIGDQSHSWLAATQYIAPLMANFDTQLEGANILYADDGEKFVVEWRKVQLRAQKEKGPFTFQAVLNKNGDMYFVYKDVPMPANNISDAHHPCKLGISDAYLFHHTASISKDTQVAKRVIYEYHRIEIPPSYITSNTVIVLSALPTCMSMSNCDECANATLARFNCSWCHAKKADGGPFCTDNAGLHRRRQQFIEGNCKDQRKSLYCPAVDDDSQATEDKEYEDESREATPSKGEATIPPTAPEGVVPLLPNNSPVSAGGSSSDGHSGWTGLFMVLTMVVLVSGWIVYAYYNPQSTSGQLLIRYRPSRWHVPSSHVRYSASVHM